VNLTKITRRQYQQKPKRRVGSFTPMWKVVLVQLIDLDLNKIAEGKTDAKGSAPAKLGVS